MRVRNTAAEPPVRAVLRRIGTVASGDAGVYAAGTDEPGDDVAVNRMSRGF
jgi:hypothetical protein